MKVFKLFFILISFSSFLYSDWPCFMANSKRTGYVDEFMKIPIEEIWSVEVPGQIISSPVIYKGKVFITTRFGYVVCLDLKTGKWLWDYSTDGFNDATPSVSSDTIIVPSMDGNVYSININSGNVLWKRYLGGLISSSPLIYFGDKNYKNGLVYIGVSVPINSLFILDFKTGDVIKKISFEKPMNSAITFCNNRIIFGGNDGRIYSANTDLSDLKYYQTKGGSFDNKAISCNESTGKLYSLPGYDERGFYVNNSTSASLLYESDDLTGNIGVSEWNWQDVSAIALSTDSMYFVAGSSNTSFFGFKLSDYSIKFSSFDVGVVSEYKISASPSVSRDKIFLTTNNSKFYVISSTGAILKEFNLTSPSYSSPAVSDGYVVVAEYSGIVRAFKALEYLYIDIPYDEIISSSYTINLKGKISDAGSYDFLYSGDGIVFTRISSGSVSSSDINLNINWDSSTLSNSTYTIKGIIYNSNNEVIAETSKIIRKNSKPLPPQNLLAKDNPNDNCNKIILTWDYPTSDFIFNIYRSSYGYDNWTLIYSTSSKTYIDKNAVCGSTFSYRVSAFDSWIESDFSPISSAYSINDNPLNDNTAPSKITELSALKGSYGGSLVLSWNEVGDDGMIGKASFYEIRYSTFIPFNPETGILKKGSVISNPGEIESVLIDKLLSYITYYFTIRACDFAENCGDYSDVISATPQFDPIAPAPPTDFQVFDTPADRGGRISLSWKISADDGSNYNDVYGYKIFRSTSSVFDYNKPYAEVGSLSYGYIDNNATIGVKYFYRVASYDSTNFSFTDIKSAISSDNYIFVSRKGGGSLYSEDGASVKIPENSLTQDDYLIFQRVNKENLSNLITPSSLNSYSFKPTSLVYELLSSNPSTELKENIILSIPYSESEISGIIEDNLRVYYLDGNYWKLIRKFSIDKSSNIITADVNNLGRYGVFGYIPQGDVFDDNFVYTYPNPARGDKLTFKFSLNYNADVEIRVYNIAGEMIAKLEKNNVLAGSIEEIVWDISKIASGVYIYVFEAKAVGKTKKIDKKLAIIK